MSPLASSTSSRSSQTSWPLRGWVGLSLIAIFWPLNWGLSGLRTHLLFFPLWLGYIFTVDALVARRRGTSIWMRSRSTFVLLFLLSAPVWWGFEVINWRTQNWIYQGRDQFSDLTYFAFASVAFSTVIPAVFETAEGVRSLPGMNRFADGFRLRPTQTVRFSMIVIGVAMLMLIMVWPTYFYPFIWGWLFFIIAPMNAQRDNRSLLKATGRGDWRPVVSLALGALICGFFWEMWNYYAFPKWVYDAPGVNFGHIFEMPLFGFIGYLPFALELYAFAHLAASRDLDLRL